jgi:gamma-glutamyltranspeptidase/glutathione hydrolase
LAALQMLNILELYDVAGMGFNSADYIHLSAEAKKLAFADRAQVRVVGGGGGGGSQK